MIWWAWLLMNEISLILLETARTGKSENPTKAGVFFTNSTSDC